VAGSAASSFCGGAAAADPEQLREAVHSGSVGKLLALDASRPEAGGLELGGSLGCLNLNWTPQTVLHIQRAAATLPLQLACSHHILPPILSFFAELLVHVRAECLEALKELQAGMESKLQQYMQVPPATLCAAAAVALCATQLPSASQPVSQAVFDSFNLPLSGAVPCTAGQWPAAAPPLHGHPA
jgi:hypothetical protein